GSEGEAACRLQASFTGAFRNAKETDCLDLAELQARVSCLVSVGLRQHSLDLCFLAKDEETRKGCLTDFLVEKAVRNGDIGACGEVEEPGIREPCRQEVFFELASKTGQEGLCGREPGEERSCRIGAAVFRIRSAVENSQLAAFASLLSKVPEKEAEAKEYDRTQAPALSLLPFLKQGNVAVSFAEQSLRQGNGGFVRYEGASLGLEKYSQTTSLEHQVPFNMGRGIASGDFNNDGWFDIAVATNQGPLLYRNVGGEFRVHPLFFEGMKELDTFLVAFVDIDNDGKQDLFLSSFGGRNVFVLNGEDGFLNPRLVERPGREDRILTEAAAFGDVDGDGFLDVVLGNWSSVAERAESFSWSQNQLFLNRGLEFVSAELAGPPAETLSVLFSDFTHDGVLDIMVGNDFEAPDMYYKGEGNGIFSPFVNEDGVFPFTTQNTRSLDTADFNNDLLLDVFATDMSFGPNSETDYCSLIKREEDRRACEKSVHAQERILPAKDMKACLLFQDAKEKNDCLVAVVKGIAVDFRNPELCAKIPEAYVTHKIHCKVASAEHPVSLVADSRDLPQVFRNVLLIGTLQGDFVDRAEAAGVAESFWSWNAKAADLDNDEWQDIFIGNGFLLTHIHPNTFFRNLGDGTFEQAQEAFGLDDPIHTPSYTFVDYDNDGDLDIIATGISAPLRVFENREAGNNSISFELRDAQGNSRGVGAKVYIAYGEGRRQIRELKLGGGFLSFDIPLAHFGLGEHREVGRVEVQWPSGETSLFEGPFPANRRYVIWRAAP
ncbi:MAG: CRTAC1 family protein, partial [bacterium]|nr:CRTAC1 family protein [bacterium]